MTPEILSALTRWVHLILPEMVLGVAVCVLILGGLFRVSRSLWAIFSLSALIVAGIVAWFAPMSTPHTGAALFISPILIDPLALLIRGIALAAGIVLVLLSWDEITDRQAGEYYACLLLIVAGLSLTGMANELVTLFLALELISIPTYILLYLPRYDRGTQEAAMKYFMLSIFSSALLLFGFSYLYGLAGTTNMPALAQALTSAGSRGLPGVALIALVMVVAGMGFRITAVPFHFYAPDVYQGAPTVAAALLAFVPKASGFVALLRILGFIPHADILGRVYPGLILGTQSSTLFWILAAVTMILGNVLALLQDNVKRMLAYSSVAHAGYMLIGLAVAPYLSASHSSNLGPGGVEAVLFYIAAYGAMTIGAFAVLSYLSTPWRNTETIEDLTGLGQTHPCVALLMAIFMFSLIGIPLTAGFVGKFFLFFGAMAVRSLPHEPATWEQAQLFRILAFIGVINAAIGAWYYLRIIAVMFLRSPVKYIEQQRTRPALAAIVLCAFLTIGLGVYPWPLLKWAEASVPHPMSQQRAQR